LRSTELLNQAWNKQKLKHRSPNVCNLIQRSTRLSLWVASVILYAEQASQRAKVVEKMIDICLVLKKHLNNYNTLMGMLAGLNLSPIHRLKKTDKKVPKDKRKDMEDLLALMSPDASYKSYRASLQVSSLPALPYLGVSLTDLTFIEEGNADVLNGQINFRKREMIYKVIREVTQYQTQPYPFTPIEPIHTFLQELASSSSEELYKLSLWVEPRESSDKKK